jgi:hypothetical protein
VYLGLSLGARQHARTVGQIWGAGLQQDRDDRRIAEESLPTGVAGGLVDDLA